MVASSPHQRDKAKRMTTNSSFGRVPAPVVLSTLLLLLLLHVQPGSCALTDTEKKFVAIPSPDGAREALEFITSKPHVAGTPGDHEVSMVARRERQSCGVSVFNGGGVCCQQYIHIMI